MIDLQYAKKAFENYLNDYDQKNEKIKLKIVHTYGVMECSKKITEDIVLINIIGYAMVCHGLRRNSQTKR